MEEKPNWEQAVKAEELRRAKELEMLRVGQQKALEDITKSVGKGGNNPVELEEKRRAFEEKCRQQLEAKMREQQERLNRLELLYKGPPAGRERG